MDTLPPDPIELIAIAPSRNIHRRWSLTATRDLFGRIAIETQWGRVGSSGRHLVRSFADDAAALRYVRHLLARRRSAERRLGVGYVPRGGRTLIGVKRVAGV